MRIEIKRRDKTVSIVCYNIVVAFSSGVWEVLGHHHLSYSAALTTGPYFSIIGVCGCYVQFNNGIIHCTFITKEIAEFAVIMIHIAAKAYKKKIKELSHDTK